MAAPYRNPNVLAMVATMVDRRAAGRVRVKKLRSRHGKVSGDVSDLSRTGARLLFSGGANLKAGDQSSITIAFGESQVTLRAQVMWVRQASRKEHLMGVKFEALNESEAAAVAHLARIGREAMAAAAAREEC